VPAQKYSRPVKIYPVVTACLVLLMGCSGEPESSTDSNPSPKAASSATAAEVALVDLCPEVAKALEDIDFPTEDQLVTLHEEITGLAGGANLEAQNALGIFALDIESAQAAYDDPDNLTPALAASERFDEGIVSVKKRCQEVGSSAFPS
jgi:hypothetical protein